MSVEWQSSAWGQSVIDLTRNTASKLYTESEIASLALCPLSTFPEWQKIDKGYGARTLIYRFVEVPPVRCNFIQARKLNLYQNDFNFFTSHSDYDAIRNDLIEITRVSLKTYGKYFVV